MLLCTERGQERALSMCESGEYVIRRESGYLNKGKLFLLRPHLRFNPCRVKGCPHVAAREDDDLVQIAVNGGPSKIMARSQVVEHLQRHQKATHRAPGVWGYSTEMVGVNGLCEKHEVEQEMVKVLWALKHIKIAEAFRSTDRMLECLD